MQILALALAGALGTLARYAVGLWLPPTAGFPWATLLVNVVGSFVLSLVAHAVVAKTLGPEWRLIVGIGFCGAFTTYSAFALEADALWGRGEQLGAFGFVLANLVLGFVAVVLGRVVAGLVFVA